MEGRTALGRDPADGFEAPVATGAAQGRENDGFGFGLCAEAEEVADAPQGFVGGGAEEAVVAHADEAFGQDVEEPAADELDGLKRDGFPEAAAAVFAAQEDASVAVAALEALFAEGGFADVGGGVAQGGLAPADGPDVEPPLAGPDRRIDAAVEFGVFVGEGGLEAVAEAVGQRLPGDEEAAVFGTGERASAGSQADGGDDQVKVRMVEHLPRPSVEDGEKAGIGAEVARVAAEVAQGAGGGFEEQAEGRPRFVEKDPAQLFGHGRGDHVIGHRQQAGLLFGRPPALVEGTAPRAGAVVATVPDMMDGAAVGAEVGRAAHARGAAGEDRLHRPAVSGGDAVKAARPFDTGGPVLFENAGQGHGVPMISPKRFSRTEARTRLTSERVRTTGRGASRRMVNSRHSFQSRPRKSR